MPTAHVNGLNMYYVLHGHGQPLVMIMDLGANSDWWDTAIVQRLSQRHQLLLLDNRGAGRTDKPAGQYSIPMLAQDTIALMNQVGIHRAHVLGASMGGMIAQELALSHPDRVDKLILACTGCGGAQSILPSIKVVGMLLDRRGSPEQRIARQARLLFPDDYIAQNPDKLEQLWDQISRWPTPPDAFRRQFGAILRFRSYDRLPQIKSPTLIMTGSEDVLIPPQNSDILAAGIPGARLETFDGGGHGFTSQFPERFCQVVEEFLG